MEKVSVHTSNRSELIDITGKINALVAGAKVQSGICYIFCPHTTAGLTINENADPSVRRDITTAVDALVPGIGDYTHAEGNSDSHIKSSLFGFSLPVFIEQGKLALGTWQGIYFCESDGPRSRQVWVKIVADAH